MTEKVSAQLIASQARQLHQADLTEQRCAELAEEVGNYNGKVAEAALELEFDNEPAEFAKLLRSLRREPPP